MSQKKRLTRLAAAAALVCALPASGDEGTAADSRIALPLTPAEKAQFLGEMRQMLVSIQGIMKGIGQEDRPAIMDAARASGNRMARATPASVRAKLPQSFKELGHPTHMLFEELAVRADTDEMADLAVLTGELMENCVACHAKFRVE